ncbi:cytidine deaminase-like protein [Rostrohypoxylon terebratum]|nr:cytidine deaminase-like protein [Rostrohypoxylon terebratum]
MAENIPQNGINPGDHISYMKLALSLATKSPPKPTNYRVGAVVVNAVTNEILATGYTLELPGNTHAEQCCFEKISQTYDVPASRLGEVLSDEVILYTTVEPCSQRLSGNLPCADRILAIGNKIKTVYVGVCEPEKFVNGNSSKKKLEDTGIGFVHVTGLEKEILQVATAGHEKST